MINLILTLIFFIWVPTLSYADQTSTFIQGPALVESMATVATSGGTTNLTAASVTRQIFTGTMAQTVVLPDATTLKSGRQFTIVNESTGTLSINTFGGAPFMTVLPATSVELVVKSIASSAGTWSKTLVGTNGGLAASLFGNAGLSASTNFIGSTDGVDFVMRANNTEVARLKQATGAFHISGPFDSAYTTDAATTGANASIPMPAKFVVRLTNASLTSVDMIVAPTDTAVARTFILENVTGSTITINDETGGTAANRIRTGTGSSITMANNASLLFNYDNESDRWRIVGGSGGSTLTLAAVGSSPNANGATLSGSTLNLEPASASFPGVVSTVAQTFPGTKTFAGGINANSYFAVSLTDDATTTGSNATISGSTQVVHRLTNASLVSVAGAVSTSSVRYFRYLVNATGNSITIKNESASATAADRIMTGTGADITLANTASLWMVYDSNASRWRTVGGGSGTSFSAQVYGTYASPSSVSAVTCIDSSIVTSTGQKLVVFVQGNGGPVTCSASQQILASSTVGDEITVIGRSDSNTLTLINGNGLKLNGDWTGGDGDSIRLMYVTTNTWQELNRSN